MKYYLLKVDDNDHWFASPLNNDVHLDKDKVVYDGKFVELSNFGDEGEFIKREVRVNIEERE